MQLTCNYNIKKIINDDQVEQICLTSTESRLDPRFNHEVLDARIHNDCIQVLDEAGECIISYAAFPIKDYNLSLDVFISERALNGNDMVHAKLKF